MNNRTETSRFENIDLCMINFYDPTKPCSDLKCKENRQYDEHISHKTQKSKGIHSTVQAELLKLIVYILQI